MKIKLIFAMALVIAVLVLGCTGAKKSEDLSLQNMPYASGEQDSSLSRSSEDFEVDSLRVPDFPEDDDFELEPVI